MFYDFLILKESLSLFANVGNRVEITEGALFVSITISFTVARHQGDYHRAAKELFRRRLTRNFVGRRSNPGFRLSYLSALNAVPLDETAKQER